ncbi:MAG TPA: hypothetical protein VGQ04_20395 [Chitinophagaceae bacterium]|jgi:PhnB protein|nr:hypothetical protein [Chitinophagaceae bacterium]
MQLHCVNGIMMMVLLQLGLFVDDPHAVMAKAVAAGGTEIDPVQDYYYNYRQGCLGDPFGHHWLIEKKIG